MCKKLNRKVIERANAEVRSLVSEGYVIVFSAGGADCDFLHYRLRHRRNCNSVWVNVNSGGFAVYKNNKLVKSEIFT